MIVTHEAPRGCLKSPTSQFVSSVEHIPYYDLGDDASFGILPLNQTEECQLTCFLGGCRESQVSETENLSLIGWIPGFHRNDHQPLS